jgi:fermentation-respiration switch protein FrsA (DUF1100 family)
MAQRRFPYFPARWLVRDRFDSIAKIASVEMPVLVLHGVRDAITPASLGERLYEAARQPKELRLFPEAGHADLYDHGAEQAVIAFVDRMMTAEGPGAAVLVAD